MENRIALIPQNDLAKGGAAMFTKWLEGFE
jgi:hypothetical protein